MPTYRAMLPFLYLNEVILPGWEITFSRQEAQYLVLQEKLVLITDDDTIPPTDDGSPRVVRRNIFAMHYGTGAPTEDIGLTGDGYVDQTSGELWHRTGEGWELRIKLGGGGGDMIGQVVEIHSDQPEIIQEDRVYLRNDGRVIDPQVYPDLWAIQKPHVTPAFSHHPLWGTDTYRMISGTQQYRPSVGVCAIHDDTVVWASGSTLLINDGETRYTRTLTGSWAIKKGLFYDGYWYFVGTGGNVFQTQMLTGGQFLASPTTTAYYDIIVHNGTVLFVADRLYRSEGQTLVPHSDPVANVRAASSNGSNNLSFHPKPRSLSKHRWFELPFDFRI